MTDLTHFFWPRSIALIGASDNPSTIRGRLLEFLLQREYRGKLYLISSTQSEIRGRRTFASVTEVAEPIDLALVALRADATLKVLEECARVGVKFVVCFGSGFSDEGAAGLTLQRQFAKFAQPGAMRICGPNTNGFFNVRGMVAATFTRSVDARRPTADLGRLEAGGVGIVAQSGGLGFALQHRCAVQHGLGFSYIASTGNEADLEVLDFVEYMVDDPETKVVLLVIEALKNGRKLFSVARRAALVGKPIVVAKFGCTIAGGRAATSHAGRLTGSDVAYDAVFRRNGIIRVDDEEEMTDLAAVFSRCPLPKGKRVAIVTTSGGAGVWMTDACEKAGLEVPLLDEETQAALAQHVPSFGSTLNPIDMTAQVTLNPMSAHEDKSALIHTLDIVSRSSAVDAIVFIGNLADGDVLLREQQAWIDLVKHLDKPLVFYAHALPSHASLHFIWEMGLMCFGSTRRTARALKGLADYAIFQRESNSPRPEESEKPQRSYGDHIDGLSGELCEYQAKALLRRIGIATPREQLARDPAEAVAAARALGGPVALKIQSPQIAHKTEIGGVMLGVVGEAQVRAGFVELMERAQRACPRADLHGVLVQEMLSTAREVAIGVVRDPDFGPLMMIAMGGIHIEVLRDVITEPLPVRRVTALNMLSRLRGADILSGARGEARGDLGALAELMERLSILVEGNAGAIREIDLNPVFLYSEGNGVTVVDALVTCEEVTNEKAPVA